MKMIQPPTSHDARSHKCQQVRLGHVWKNNIAYDWRMYLFARRYICMPYTAFQNQTPPTYHRSTPTAFKTCPAAMLTHQLQSCPRSTKTPMCLPRMS